MRRETLAKADAILRDLAKLGYALIPLKDSEDVTFHFPDVEVESLAKTEHNRFVKDMFSKDWQYSNEPLDPIKKNSPDLIPWDELPVEKKEQVRKVMRSLPAALAQAGFQIVPQ